MNTTADRCAPLSPLRRVVLLLAVILAATPLIALSTTYSPIHLVGEIASRPGHAVPGATVTFAPGFSPGGTPPAGSYRWFKDGVLILGATASTLVRSNLTAADNGIYTFEVTTATGVTQSNPYTLNVTPPPPSPVDLSFTSQVYADDLLVGASDGSVVSVATLYPPITSYTTLQVVRFKADGSADPSLNYTQLDKRPVAVLPDGSLLTRSLPYLIHPDGTPAVTTPPPSFDRELDAIAPQPDGKFLLALNYPARITRLNADGSVDPTLAYREFPSDRTIRTLTVDPQGRVLVLFDVTTSPRRDSYSLLVRLTATGADDPTFTAVRNVSTAVPLAGGGLLAILATGTDSYSYTSAIERLNDDGTRIPGYVSEAPLPWRAGTVVLDPDGWVFATDVYGAVRRYTVGADHIAFDPSFYPGPDAINQLWRLDSGHLVLRAAAGLLRIRKADQVPPCAPVVALSADRNDYSAYNSGPHGIRGTMPALGESVRFTSRAEGIGPLSYQWLALDGQALPADTTSPNLSFATTSPANFGRFQLRVTSPGGTTFSDPIFMGYPIQRPYLANLSGRAAAGTGENTIIAGLVTAAPLTGLLRGVGPALKPLGVTSFLSNPAIDLFNAHGALIGNNDNWGSLGNAAAIADFADKAGAFPLAPGSLDAAGLTQFGAGVYSVHLFDQSGASGIGMLEVYTYFQPTSTTASDQLLNLSFRAHTGPGEETAIAGLVIVDPQNYGRSVQVLLRAVGPGLISQGIVHPLTNPLLTVYNSSGEVVARNDDWSLSPATNPTAAADIAAAGKKVGAFDLLADSHDAALLLDLPAGAYTLHATAADGSAKEGVVLLEIYLVR